MIEQVLPLPQRRTGLHLPAVRCAGVQGKENRHRRGRALVLVLRAGLFLTGLVLVLHAGAAEAPDSRTPRRPPPSAGATWRPDTASVRHVRVPPPCN